ncbi:hypothetical protein B0H63DRAFT_413350 [Podospora didyma]|uniref:Amine oxidase n=1 Tax=Podospora didyma TaxID=330526 RepID=A0AAE0U237_9PEZI|nr:hypothetical protein B0H63DRAFT_413350 [Podospora didyma]
MAPSGTVTLRFLSGLLATATLGASTVLPQSIASRVLFKDVAIIGGGASGSHAALRLKEDYGKSVVVIDAQSRLGGHVSSYKDATTGQEYDYGVNAFDDYGPAKAFFTRLGVSTTPAAHGGSPSLYVDFSTGAPVNYTAPAMPDVFGALGAFYGIVKPWERFLIPSYSQFPVPSAIPADLLLTFGQFVAKYSLQAAVPQIFAVTGAGLGDMLSVPTLYVLQAFGITTLESFLGISTSFVPVSGRNIQIYEAISTRLGGDVLYSSTVAQSLRTLFGVVLWVKGADGKYTLVIADKLLVAIEPTAANLDPLNPTNAETAVFSKFKYSTLYAGIVSHPSLPTDVTLTNTPSTAAPANWLDLPKPNFNGAFVCINPTTKLWQVSVVGDENLTSQGAQDLLARNVNAMISSGVLPAAAGATLQFKAWAVHGAMHARVTASELQAGFIQKLVALQGKSSTWYTGAAWSATSTSVLWAYNDALLPSLVAA